MKRETFVYGERRALTRSYEGFDVETPIAGFYAMPLRSGGVRVGIRIWYGPPLDPVTGEELDRSWRWQAMANGSYIDMERVWPKCANSQVDQSEHDYLVNLQGWAEEHDPTGAIANPNQKLNPLTTPIAF